MAAPVVMKAEDVDCLVVGGGISGLTTAFYADRGGAKVLLAEKGKKLGGVIETQGDDGAAFQWEDGPNTFQASAKGMLRLVAGIVSGLRYPRSHQKLKPDPFSEFPFRFDESTLLRICLRQISG